MGSEMCIRDRKSDHKAITAYAGQVHIPLLNKRSYRRNFRRRSPEQHARFLEFVSTLNIELDDNEDVQSNFDTMYGVMIHLLDRFYRTGPVGRSGARDNGDDIRSAVRHAYCQGDAATQEPLDARWAD